MMPSPVGFKEWSLVCAALGQGAQSLILRKGGIHEGKAGFWWRHDHFYLFPTHFHEQEVQFRWNAPQADQWEKANNSHRIEYFATVEKKLQITDWRTVERLEGLHFWTSETLRERFDYSEATGISMAFLRVYRLNAVWIIPDEKRFGGCRSWLDLPSLPGLPHLTPVLDDPEHAARLLEVEKRLNLPEF
jgi:hypothetical protein